MTLEDLQNQCLRLSEAERATLARQLMESLTEAERFETLRRQLEMIEGRRMEGFRQKIEAEISTWFEGESIELTDEIWQRITSKDVTEEELDTPFGVEAPPEWTGRTLRELIAATQK